MSWKLNNRIQYYLKHIINKDQFILTDYVDNVILEGLYYDEFALIYPSLYEGFGFPAIFAMKYGKNVITTSWTSLPEVCGDVAYYFNPIDKYSFIVAVLNCLEHPVDKAKILKRYERIHSKQDKDLKKLASEILCGH